jgi:hypothetical protein
LYLSTNSANASWSPANSLPNQLSSRFFLASSAKNIPFLPLVAIQAQQVSDFFLKSIFETYFSKHTTISQNTTLVPKTKNTQDAEKCEKTYI